MPSLADSLFRDEISDIDEGGEKDILFDITSKSGISGSLSTPLKQSDTGIGRSGFKLFNPFSGLSSPDIQSPDIQSPDIQAPDIQSPDIQAPDIQSPDIQAPDIEAPDIQAPDIEAPDIQAPDIQAPDIQAPDIQAPDIQAPDIQAPDIQAPDIQAPDIEAPDIEAPDIQAPDIDLPRINLPDIDFPSSNDGKVQLSTGIGGDLTNGISIEQDDGSFGQIGTYGGGAIDVSDRLESEWSNVTKGTDAEGIKLKDLNDFYLDPAGALEKHGEDKLNSALSQYSDIGTEDIKELIDFAKDPVDYIENKGVDKAKELAQKSVEKKIKKTVEKELKEQFGDSVSDKLVNDATKQIANEYGAELIVGIGTLINGGNVKDARNAAAKEFVYQSLNSFMPGSGSLVRVLADKQVSQIVDFAFKPTDIALEALGDLGEEALDLVKDVTGAISFAGGTLLDVVDPIDSITSYGCNLSTAAYRSSFITKDEFLDFPRFRIRFQKHERGADKFWSGYVILTNPIQDFLVLNKNIGYVTYKLITRPWLNHMQFIMGKKKFSIFGFLAMQFMRVISISAYFINKHKCDSLNTFFETNSIMSVYRKTIKGVSKCR